MGWLQAAVLVLEIIAKVLGMVKAKGPSEKALDKKAKLEKEIEERRKTGRPKWR